MSLISSILSSPPTKLVMLSSRPSGLAPQLKDSYIAISTYVRRRYCQPFPKLRRNFTFQAGGNAELQETSPTRREDETPVEGRQQPVCMSNKELVSPVTHYKNICKLRSTWFAAGGSVLIRKKLNCPAQHGIGAIRILGQTEHLQCMVI